MNDLASTASEPAAQPVDEPLSQWQRLLYVFFAPSKTFADIRRNASWWLPFLVTALVGYGFTYSVGRQVGWEKVVETTIQQSPKQQERIANMTADQAAAAKEGMVMFFRSIAYAGPLFSLMVAAVAAALLLATMNFVFAGHAKFGQMMAVYYYATLPLNLKYLLAIVTLFAGVNTDQFKIQNPIGSNIGYYLSPDLPGWLITVATQIGIFTIWSLVLVALGGGIVAGVKRKQSGMAVAGWWILLMVVTAGWAALASGQ
ncbi:MAG TPA: YIP1 family protein [Acidobacteriaceae bacterium]|nr:YIP1 family protein [Acidobacteriaceae bacterium]